MQPQAKPECLHRSSPLTRLRTGSRAVVLSLSHPSARERGKLMALGLMPGVTLRVLQRFPSYVVALGYTQITLDSQTAQLVEVQPE